MSLPDGGGTGLDARRFATTSVAPATGALPVVDDADPSSAGNSVNASASRKSLSGVSATGSLAVEAISSPVGNRRRERRNRAIMPGQRSARRGNHYTRMRTAVYFQNSDAK